MTAPRPPSPRSALDRERILAAALGILDREGVEALSMRRVAAELDVTAMSLYRHVRNKDELLDVLVRTALAAVPVPGPEVVGWENRIRALFGGVRAFLLEHPAVGELASERPPLDPTADLKVFENLHAALTEAGLDPEEAARAQSLLWAYSIGRIQHEHAWRRQEERTGRSHEQTTGALARQVDPAAYPYLARSVATWPSISAESQYAWGLERILDGLRALVAGRRPRDRATPDGQPASDA